MSMILFLIVIGLCGYIGWVLLQVFAKFLWLSEWIPLGRFAPYILGLSMGRMPRRIKKSTKED